MIMGHRVSRIRNVMFAMELSGQARQTEGVPSHQRVINHSSPERLSMGDPQQRSKCRKGMVTVKQPRRHDKTGEAWWRGRSDTAIRHRAANFKLMKIL